MSGVTLAYARKTGFGGNTGNLLRGARVIRVNVEQQIYWATSWIRDFDGFVLNQNTPAEACSRIINPSITPNSSTPVTPVAS